MYPGKWAKEFPDKPAIVHAVSGEAVSYAELNNRSNQLAQLMWADGLRPGDHAAIFMENHLRYFEVVWAALRSGLYLTTINRYLTDEEAGYILDNCEAKVLITSSKLAEVAAELPGFAPACSRWLMVDGAVDGYEGYESAIAAHPAEPLADEPAGQFMLYSSGTTGRPKGILRPLTGTKIHEDAGPVGALQQMLWGFDSDTVYLSPAPLYHSAPIGFCTAALALGGTVVMMPRFDEVGALRAIEEHQVTHSQWVPTMFTRILKLPESGTNRPRLLQPQGGHPRRRSLPFRHQAADDRLVGTDHLRVLRRHRAERADPRHVRGVACQSRHCRQTHTRHHPHL